MQQKLTCWENSGMPPDHPPRELGDSPFLQHYLAKMVQELSVLGAHS